MFVLTQAKAFFILKLREKRASKWPFILKPFSWRFFGFGQPPEPHQSRKSQPFVKPEADLLVFSNLVTPYSVFHFNELLLSTPKLSASAPNVLAKLTVSHSSVASVMRKIPVFPHGHAILMNK